MESSVFLSDLLTAHEPELHKSLQCRQATFRFMGRPLSFFACIGTMNYPLTRPSGTLSPRRGRGMGGRGRFMERFPRKISRIEPLNLVGTARCAVRAAFSGATMPPAASRAGTSQRDVPTQVRFMESLAPPTDLRAGLKLVSDGRGKRISPARKCTLLPHDNLANRQLALAPPVDPMAGDLLDRKGTKKCAAVVPKQDTDAGCLFPFGHDAHSPDQRHDDRSRLNAPRYIYDHPTSRAVGPGLPKGSFRGQ